MSNRTFIKPIRDRYPWLHICLMMIGLCFAQTVRSESYILSVGESVTISQSPEGGGYIDNVGLADYLDGHLSFTKNYDGSAKITIKSYFDYTATVKLVFIERYTYLGHTRAATYYHDVTIRCKYEKPDPTKKPTKVSLPERIRIPINSGERTYITPILEPTGAKGTDYNWGNSQGTASFSVHPVSDGTCWVKGLSPGVGEIYVVVDNDWQNLKAETIIEVVDPTNLPPTSIFLPTSIEISVNGHATLSPTLVPESSSTSYTWKSDNESVASVSYGKVTGHKVGKATITLTTGNQLTASCEITVVQRNGKDDEDADDEGTTGVVGGHEYVDLGLSVKWATCNVDASSPEEYGGYYAWGETSEKSTYTWSTYKHCGGSIMSVYDIGSDIKGTSYDVAYVKWGSDWRMPTEKEMGELVTKCTFKPTTQNGVEGYMITGPNGSSMFLPTAGIKQDKYSNGCQYWTSTVHKGDYGISLYIYTDSYGNAKPTTMGQMRSFGFPVRAVTKASGTVVEPTAVSLPSSATVKVGSTITLTPTLTPSNAKTTLIWSSDDSSIATVSSSGVVTGVKAGSTYINVSTANGKTDYCKVTVEANSVEPTSITLPSSKTVKVGESFTMNYTLTPSNATTTLTWSSDDFSIATVSSTGVVKGIKEGSTKIRVSTANGKTDYCNVTVKDDSNYEPLDIVEQNLAAGSYHSLILKKDGTLWACGWNFCGSLGDGTTTARHTPVRIMDNVVNMEAGTAHSLILKKDGTLWACGWNFGGQLGDGTTTARYTPVQIMDDVANIAAGDGHSLILKKDGTLWACGYNSMGQLGDGTTTDRHTPVQIMDDVANIAAGDGHSLILRKDGSLWACGDNKYGQLGDGTTTERHTPVRIMDNVANMAAGGGYSLILRKDGTLWACGYNEYGQLGDGTTTDRHTPIQIMNNVANMAAGYRHSLILRKDGTLWACGVNEYGQLGDGTTTERHTPVKMQIVYDDEQTIDVTTSDKGYATFYSSKSAYSLPKGLSAQVVTEVSDGKLSYQTIADGYESGIIPRGVAVMLTNDSIRKEKFTLTAAESNVTYSGRNMLSGSDVPTTTTSERSNCLFYKLAYAQNSSDLFGWFWGAKDGAAFQIEGHRAWLSVPKTAGVKAFVIEGDATGIADLQPTSSSGAIYDLQGRRIPKPTHKGVYVIDGRKVVIK